MRTMFFKKTGKKEALLSFLFNFVKPASFLIMTLDECLSESDPQEEKGKTMNKQRFVTKQAQLT